jgi:peptidoglycan/LPS O-acetylase OafA/YrhL
MIAWLVGASVLLYFPIWVMGALVFYVPKSTVSNRLRGVLLGISAVVFAGTTILAHSYWKNQLFSDYCMSTAFAVFLYFLINHATEVGDMYSKVSHEMASSSYTLYVVHTPFLVFIAVWIGGRWIPTPLHVTYAVLILGAAWIYAHLIHMVFEAHTDQIRSWAERKLGLA